ncbi:MAG TPA: peptidoglycan recognition family protein [Candidatus Angelobacter sp.]|nr:peptidoglycan recognition family protein [Candidatus Angelobacter sp.]
MPVWKGIVGKSFTPKEFAKYVTTVELNTWRPQFVVLHNTATPKLSEWHTIPGPQRIKGLEKFYRDTQKWSAGPHLFVADDLIWAFTPLNTSGIHAPSWNAISWGVELVGDYSVEKLSDGSRENLIASLATLHSLAGLDPHGLRLHKEDPKTTHKGCPGKNIGKATVIQWVAERMAHNHPGEHSPAKLKATLKAAS